MSRFFITRIAAAIVAAVSASGATASGDFYFFVGQTRYELNTLPGAFAGTTQAIVTDPLQNDVWGQLPARVESFADRLAVALNGGSATDGATATVFDGFSFNYTDGFLFGRDLRGGDTEVRTQFVANDTQSATGTWVTGKKTIAITDTSFTTNKIAGSFNTVFLTAVAVPEINGSAFAQLGLVAGGGYIALRRRLKPAPATA